MERIKKKLHSQSGASFLFALLAFLVAAVVSVTIISAAVTTVRRVNSDREAQQAQLTLDSAAQLVRDEMEETKYIITTTKTETTTTTIEENGTSTSTTDVTIRVDKSAEGTFATEMKTAVEYVQDHEHLTVPYTADDAFQIKVDGASGFKMAPVNVSFIMKTGEEKYHLVFTLSIDGTGETLYLKMNGSGPSQYGEPVTTTTSSDNSSTTVTVSREAITWSQGIINGVGDSNE